MKNRHALLNRAERTGYPRAKLSFPWHDSEARIEFEGPQYWTLLAMFGNSSTLDALDAQLALLDAIDVEGTLVKPTLGLVVWKGGEGVSK